MDIHPIRTKQDYAAALKVASALVDADPAPGTEAGDKLDVLSILIERYEVDHFPLKAPSPIEAIKFRMEQAGLSVGDMKPYIGNSNRVYEVLNGRRELSLAMIRRLHDGLHIPADVLIGSA
ncbi:type II toxin-antitoxin system HigA family antitoxin [Achromobacter sp. AONIH1]|jgi:HTH-type transcriptional regulator/antitoxin HigA|uniref:helix-turn-helix domain-containing protein n=1 Tax=unclassified Achromobacter TaxID=2626865 RepID=UPI000CD16ABC|nr:transcriptional regulator [Achromobacter sp. AONIH1]AUT49949.1 transcriptional regulator [Achromobacter sp. AONIH1]